ncbi:helix-turn-helix domain-containing protein [Paenarthrobacter nitroguajacolicus]|uniref:helix-turn-helix domain-containing protein n=1 Tax=Paenarthrobacter nitroguajacolicus TaxID=211146 RepID=UPI000AF1A96B|nr:helix-turn-helix domain-containing protein [Paenarthrobacter nitroguajacolicus]
MHKQFRVGHADTPHAAVQPSPFMTRRETAAFLKVSEKWLAQSGKAIGPDFHKFGNHCRYHVDDVVRWARQQQVRR